MQRVPHSQVQLDQADQSGHIEATHRRSRRQSTTHAIDDLSPDVIADRDDGIFIELKEGGDGYKVTVTIADVAAHVPIGSELSRVAHERAFTRYLSEGNDPMFPKNLEELMSLEHGQERLGLSVIMELDHDYHLTHTAFEPVIVTPDNVDYAMAEARSADDPQFSRMGKVARGIFEQTFGGNASLLRDATPIKPQDNATSDRSMKAELMVASYMLLANHAVASFFKQTGLPFVYRNFDGSHKSPTGDDRACYATEFTAHTELEKAGLAGAYCHFTSPIRRGADYYNGHMVHYVLGIVEAIEEELQRENLRYDKQALWDLMPTLLKSYHAMRQNPSLQTERNFIVEVQHLLPSLTADIMPPEQIKRTSGSICTSLHQMPSLKLTDERLQQVVQEINTLSDQERDHAEPSELRNAAKQQERAQAVSGYSRSVMSGMDKERFSSALRNCALTGLLPDAVYEEAIARIETDYTNTALDAMHIMVTAHPYQDGRWRELKKAMAKAIKHDSGVVNNVLTMAGYYGYFEDNGVVETCARMPVHGAAERNHAVHAAILYTYPEKQSPPFYSLGHDERAAITHARYSFLEKFTFGELRPLGESAAPNLLYAGLGDAPEAKEEVLRSLVDAHGAQIDVQHRVTAKGEHTLAVKVEGGVFPKKISATAHADTEEEAKRKVTRKILRQPDFMQYVQSVSSEKMHLWLHPKETLESEVSEKGWQMRIRTEDRSTRGKSKHQCKVSLYTDTGLYSYTAEGINKSRAINSACVKALMENPFIEIAAPKEAMGQSWVDDITQNPPDTLINSGAKPTVFKGFDPVRARG